MQPAMTACGTVHCVRTLSSYACRGLMTKLKQSDAVAYALSTTMLNHMCNACMLA
jgi:hypothetical protein